MLEISTVMFAYAIGLRKISLFINIARWLVTIEKFKDLESLAQYKHLRDQKQEDSSSNTFYMVMGFLFLVIFMHVILLLSVFFYNTETILAILTFVHYYPMSIVIIAFFIYIFIGFNRFVINQLNNQSCSHLEKDELRKVRLQTLALFILICQREVVEIVSYTIWPLKDSRIPNPIAANVVFSALNYPSIILYITAYIISIQIILNSLKPI
jgi:hypothetical protein